MSYRNMTYLKPVFSFEKIIWECGLATQSEQDFTAIDSQGRINVGGPDEDRIKSVVYCSRHPGQPEEIEIPYTVCRRAGFPREIRLAILARGGMRR